MADKPTYQELAQRVKDLELEVEKYKSLEERFRERELISNSFFDNAHEYMGIIDVLDDECDLRYVKLNQAAGQYVTRHPEAMQGMLASQIGVTEEVRRQWIEQCRKSERTGIPAKFEYKRELPDGLHTLLASASLVKSPRFSFVIMDITERKRAEEQLRKSERNLAEAQKLAHVGSWEWDVRTGKVEWSDEVYRIFHLDPEHFEPQIDSIMSRFHPDDRSRYEELIKQLLASRESYSFDARILLPDGAVRETVSTAQGRYDDEGRLTRIIGTVLDITEHKRAEEALKKSEMLLDATQRLSKVGGWEWNVEKQTATWTAETYRIHELDPDEIEADSAEHIERSLECYDEKDRPVIQEAFQQCASEGKSYDMEFPFTTVKGKRIWVRTVAKAVEKNGKIARVIGNIMDITERKKVERALYVSEERLRAIFAASPAGLALFDTEFRYILVNEAMASFNGVPVEDHAGRRITEVLPESGHIVEGLFQKILDTGEPIFDLELSGEVEGRPGETSYFTVSYFPIPRQSRASVAIGAVVIDITKRKKAEEELEQALAEKTTLLQELYHRTKNNMQVIHAMLALRALHVQDEPLLTILKDVQDKIYSMELVHQKLYRSRNLSSIDLQEYINDLAAHLLKSYRVKPNKISLEIETERVFVLIDTAIPCGLIFSELISNALKHAFPGDSAGRIKIQLHQAKDETITLYVSDNGIGIPGDFDVRKSDSMGLRTVIGIVEQQLQGEITFETDHGVAWQIRFIDNLYRPRV